MSNKKDSYNPRDVDHTLRDTVNVICSLSEQIFYGIYDDSDHTEKEKFKEDIKKYSSQLYASLNESIVNKANETKKLNDLITKINDELADKNIKLIQKNEENLRNQEFKDFLFNTIIHDMKNPVSSILQYIENYSQTVTDNVEFIKSLEPIKNSSTFLQNLILNLLDISKIEDNKFVLNLSKTTFEEILDKSLLYFTLHRDIKKIEIKKKIEYKSEIYCDKELMERVFINIIGNAFKYAPYGKFIEIVIFERDNKINVEINNPGPIVPDNVKDKVFDKYYSIRENSSYQSGTGLGLTFCKLAIEVNKGNIKVVSPVYDNNGKGDGTGFHISFDKNELESKH